MYNLKMEELIIIITLMTLVGLLFSQPGICEQIREPVADGIFYPANPEELNGEIEEIFQFSNSLDVKGVKIFILPHSAYRYTGDIVATGLKSCEENFNTVILIGPSHIEGSQGIALNSNSYKTPLGLLNISKAKSERIIKNIEVAGYYPPAHEEEYSIEVVLPFLQFKNKDFKLIPILLGNQVDESTLEDLSKVLASIWDSETLIIGSVNIFKKETIDSIKQYMGDESKLSNFILDSEQICGKKTLLVTIFVAQRLGYDKLMLIDFKNIPSSENGYAGLSFIK